MIIKFSEVIKNDSFIKKELLRNLTKEHFDTIPDLTKNEFQQWDVKLFVNGIELELSLLETLYNKIEKLIDDEAKILFINKYKEKIDEVESKFDKIKEVVEDATEKIAIEFNITD